MTEATDRDQEVSSGSAPRATSAAPAPGALRSAGWALQEGVLWRAGDALRAVAASVRWPFESAAWALRSRVAWPLNDALHSSGPVTRGALAGAGLLLLAGAGVAGAFLANDGSGGGKTTPPRVAISTPPPVAAVIPKPSAPVAHHVLEGASPSFSAEHDAAKAGGSAADDAVPASASEAGSGNPQAGSADGKKAGPAPLKVAHRFAGAFVSYEIGKTTPRVRKVFRKTATPPLVDSLALRPPRQPASVKVPRAKVLNVVPGPRRGASVSVSVALLRVGATSELRLELQQFERKWLVSDVRG